MKAEKNSKLKSSTLNTSNNNINNNPNKNQNDNNSNSKNKWIRIVGITIAISLGLLLLCLFELLSFFIISILTFHVGYLILIVSYYKFICKINLNL